MSGLLPSALKTKTKQKEPPTITPDCRCAPSQVQQIHELGIELLVVVEEISIGHGNVAALWMAIKF